MIFSSTKTKQQCGTTAIWIRDKCIECQDIETETLIKIAHILNIRLEWVGTSKDVLCFAIAQKIQELVLKSPKSLKQIAFEETIYSLLGSEQMAKYFADKIFDCRESGWNNDWQCAKGLMKMITSRTEPLSESEWSTLTQAFRMIGYEDAPGLIKVWKQ